MVAATLDQGDGQDGGDGDVDEVEGGRVGGDKGASIDG